ncbi:MAG: hypothetical protein M0R32_07420 [Candidatus Cloacimonetes bacterium]|jgi:hypothetical protein|nr:hypothetical protein [Candidatus Cloacimonadota bacterium]
MARMTSIAKDENDTSKLQRGRYKHLGACVASEFYQTSPFFFTREGASLDLVGQARGASAFLICSGPSFANVDKELINNAPVFKMTTNNAVASIRGNAAIIVDDPSRFTLSMWLDPSITKFVPYAAMEKTLWDNRLLIDQNGKSKQQWEPFDKKVGDCPNVIGFRRNEKFMPERFLYEDTINWGMHSKWDGGGRSVFLSAIRILWLMGYRRIYLFGVDLFMDETHRYHFNEARTNSAIKGNMSTYEKLKKWFKELAPYLAAEGTIVKNANPESRLDVWPRITPEQAVYEASQHIGDFSHEKTEGMYTPIEDKMTEYGRRRNPHHVAPTKNKPIDPRSPVAISAPRIVTGPSANLSQSRIRPK